MARYEANARFQREYCMRTQALYSCQIIYSNVVVSYYTLLSMSMVTEEIVLLVFL